MDRKTSYHAHTEYCNHAIGDAKKMIEKAYKEKFEIFGISEHVHFEGRAYNRMRTSITHQNMLIEEVKELKSYYKNKMKIYMAFECELFEDYYDYYKRLLASRDVDYLIIGHHYPHTITRTERYGALVAEDLKWMTKFIDQAIDAFETGMFLYMAHPSMFLYELQEWNDVIEKESKRLINAALKHDIAFGLNLNGIIKQMNNPKGPFKYPYEPFFKLCGEMGVKVIIENDSHDVTNIGNEKARKWAYDFVKRLNLNLISELDLTAYKKRNGKI